MNNRYKRLLNEHKKAKTITRQLVEDKQDEALLSGFRNLSSRQKRMLATELAYSQKELNWELYAQLCKLLTQLQAILNDYALNAALTDYIEPLFYTEQERQ